MKNEILRRLSALALGLALLLNAAPLPQAFAVEDDTDASSSDSADSTDTADKTAVTTADGGRERACSRRDGRPARQPGERHGAL